MPLRIQMKRLDIALYREMFDDVVSEHASHPLRIFAAEIRNTHQ